MEDTGSPTPRVNGTPVADPGAPAARLVTVTVREHTFTYRLPTSRGDMREVRARYAAKLVLAGVPGESEQVAAEDGTDLLWDARLEIGLRPQRLASGETIDRGESCPAHWLRQVGDAHVLDTADVDYEEFLEVCRAIEAAITTAGAVIHG